MLSAIEIDIQPLMAAMSVDKATLKTALSTEETWEVCSHISNDLTEVVDNRQRAVETEEQRKMLALIKRAILAAAAGKKNKSAHKTVTQDAGQESAGDTGSFTEDTVAGSFTENENEIDLADPCFHEDSNDASGEREHPTSVRNCKSWDKLRQNELMLTQAMNQALGNRKDQQKRLEKKKGSHTLTFEGLPVVVTVEQEAQPQRSQEVPQRGPRRTASATSRILRSLKRNLSFTSLKRPAAATTDAAATPAGDATVSTVGTVTDSEATAGRSRGLTRANSSRNTARRQLQHKLKMKKSISSVSFSRPQSIFYGKGFGSREGLFLREGRGGSDYCDDDEMSLVSPEDRLAMINASWNQSYSNTAERRPKNDLSAAARQSLHLGRGL